MGTIRWGIVGCGAVAEKKSGPAFHAVPGSSLVAVARRDGAKAKDFATRHGVPRWYDDPSKLIKDPEVDAVYIATPPSSHCEYALQCADQGKPTYVEKPMALCTRECAAMIDAFARAGVPLFVAYYRRALPRFCLIRQRIQEGFVGTPRFVEIRLTRPPRPDELSKESPPWRVQPAISGGGPFVDLACHTLDFLDFALGPVVEARGVATNLGGHYPAEDTVVASLRFASGALASGLFSFVAPTEEDLVRIVGDQGEVQFATFAERPVVFLKNGNREEVHLPNPPVIQQPLIAHVVAELSGERGRCPSTGATAARTTRVLDAILQGFREASRNKNRWSELGRQPSLVATPHPPPTK